MKKTFQSFVFLIILLFSSFNAHAEIKLLWEKLYTGDSLVSCQARTMYHCGDYLMLFYQGMHIIDGIHNSKEGYIATDFEGNISHRNEFLSYNRLTYIASITHNDLFKHYFYNSAFIPQRLTIHTNNLGEIIYAYTDTSAERVNIPGRLFINEDSVYSIAYIEEVDKYVINIYDSDLIYSRRIELNIPALEDNIVKTVPHCALLSSDNSFYICFGGPDTCDLYYENYIVVLKFDENGNYQWDSKFQNTDFIYNIPITITETDDNKIIFIGQSYNDSHSGVITASIDRQGNLLNQNTYKLEESDYYRIAAYLPYSNKIAIAGACMGEDQYIGNRFCIWLFDELGNFIKKKIWSFHRFNIIEGIIEKDNGNILVYGKNANDSLYLAELQPEYLSVNDLLPDQSTLEVIPTIVKNSCEIKLNNIQALNLEIAIYDIFGNKVKEVSNEPALAPQKSFIVNLSGLAPGSYFVSVNAGGKMIRKKILKI